jgi:hypothetical protein
MMSRASAGESLPGGRKNPSKNMLKNLVSKNISAKLAK